MRFNTLSEIKRSLKQLRLKKGSSCLLHSSINGIGPIKGINIKKIPEVIVDLIFKEIGDNGTLSVMTPYYDYGLKNKKFDIKNSPSARELGAISSYIYNKKGLQWRPFYDQNGTSSSVIGGGPKSGSC